MRNLRQRDHSTKQFLSKHKQITQEWAIYTKGTIWPSNLRPKTNRPLKNEQFTPKTQIVIHDSHNRTRFAKTNTQDSCKNAKHTQTHIRKRTHIHTRVKQINTQDSHKHQRNMWSQNILKTITHNLHEQRRCMQKFSNTKHNHTRLTSNTKDAYDYKR